MARHIQAFEHPYVTGSPKVGFKLLPGEQFNAVLDREASCSGTWRKPNVRGGETHVPRDSSRLFIRLDKRENRPPLPNPIAFINKSDKSLPS